MNDVHSPLVKKTFETFMNQPPYLLIWSTIGAAGNPTGKAELHCRWNSSRLRKEVSIERGLFGSPRW